MQGQTMEMPKEPSKEDCCNSGCNPCIFEVYEKQLKCYQKYLETGRKDIYYQGNGISQLQYTKFLVTEIEKLCSSHYQLSFKRLSPDAKNVYWEPGNHFIFKFISDQEFCTRAYTPFKINDNTRDSLDFSIIVKKYHTGRVSPHLCSLKAGCVTLWRGPYGHYKLQPNVFDRIIMIAQGTGIAPFISIINNILNNEDDMTKIILLYCCKSMDKILFRDELYAFKSYWNFNYEVFVSTPSSDSTMKYNEPLKINKLCIDDLQKLKPYNLQKDQFLICGSHQFNEQYDNIIKNEITFTGNIVLF